MKKNSVGTDIVIAFLIVGAAAVLYPLFWMVISSLKSYNEIFNRVWGFPSIPLFSNYTEAWVRGISGYFFNSVFVTVITIAGVIVVASLCAFGLSRYRFRFSGPVLFLCIGGLMMNPQVCLIPIYSLLNTLYIRDTYGALILPYIAFRLSISVLLIRSYFLGVPKELEESARMDGCSDFKIYYKIFMPIANPIISTCAILTAYYAWNEFLFAVIFVDSEKYKTIPSGLMTFRDALSTNWGVMLAGMVIAAVPLVVLFILLQKQFIRGMTAGSVKG